MRFSYQRDIIYKSIYGLDIHPTAIDIFNLIQPISESISLGTVYRNLAQLVDKKMIRVININGKSHYDTNMDPHQHFFCKQCKTIIDCQIQNDMNVEKLKESKNIYIQEIEILFRGLCKECKLN